MSPDTKFEVAVIDMLSSEFKKKNQQKHSPLHMRRAAAPKIFCAGTPWTCGHGGFAGGDNPPRTCVSLGGTKII